jgi:hypothetical protein
MMHECDGTRGALCAVAWHGRYRVGFQFFVEQEITAWAKCTRGRPAVSEDVSRRDCDNTEACEDASDASPYIGSSLPSSLICAPTAGPSAGVCR